MGQAAKLMKIVLSELSNTANRSKKMPPKRHYDYLKARDFSTNEPDAKEMRQIRKAVIKVQHEDELAQKLEENKRYAKLQRFKSIKLRLAHLEAEYSKLKKKERQNKKISELEEQIKRIKAMLS